MVPREKSGPPLGQGDQWEQRLNVQGQGGQSGRREVTERDGGAGGWEEGGAGPCRLCGPRSGIGVLSRVGGKKCSCAGEA